MNLKIEIDLDVCERLIIDAMVLVFVTFAFFRHPNTFWGITLVGALVCTVIDYRRWRKERQEEPDPEEEVAPDPPPVAKDNVIPLKRR